MAKGELCKSAIVKLCIPCNNFFKGIIGKNFHLFNSWLFFLPNRLKNNDDDDDQHVSLENCQYEELLKDLEWDVSLIGRDLTAGRGGEQLFDVFDDVEILMTMIMIRVMMMIKLEGSVEHPNFLIVLSLFGQNTSLICQLNSPNRRNLMQKKSNKLTCLEIALVQVYCWLP